MPFCQKCLQVCGTKTQRVPSTAAAVLSTVASCNSACFTDANPPHAILLCLCFNLRSKGTTHTSARTKQRMCRAPAAHNS